MDKPTLLLIEDEEQVAQAFAGLLSKHFEVTISNSVEDGISQLALNGYKIAVVDLCFPKDTVGGFRVVKHIEEKELPVKAIVLTAVGNIERCREALKSGVFDFVEKGQPWTNDRLISSALEALEAKDQITLDLSKENVQILDEIRKAIGTDMVGVFREGVRILGWAIKEWREDRRIASIKDTRFKLYPKLLKEKEGINATRT